MDRTQAIVIPALNRAELREIEVPALEAGEVRIRTLHTLLSMGTEISIATGQRMESAKFPYVPGYQGVGRIEACADLPAPPARRPPAAARAGLAGGSRQAGGVKDFREGDLVLFQGGRVLPPHHAVWGGHQGVVVCSTYGLFRCPPQISFKVPFGPNRFFPRLRSGKKASQPIAAQKVFETYDQHVGSNL
ncbi:MAG: zinc-binding alcohol dehydrogenase family protein [Verrucomicrobia bacterium]|nr:zinc-binding alcohol dehydrogenase family protein [Verrucomicrobiota bacterium]